MFRWFAPTVEDDGAEADAERAADGDARVRAEHAVRAALRSDGAALGAMRTLPAADIVRAVGRQLAAYALPAGTAPIDVAAETAALFARAARAAPAAAPPRCTGACGDDAVGPVAAHMADVVYDAPRRLYVLVEDAGAVAARLSAADAHFRERRTATVLQTLVARAEEHVCDKGADALFEIMDLVAGEYSGVGGVGAVHAVGAAPSTGPATGSGSGSGSSLGSGPSPVVAEDAQPTPTPTPTPTPVSTPTPTLHGAAATVANVCMALNWTLALEPGANGGLVLCARVHAAPVRRAPG
jgi:hypothetical protein